MNIALRHRLCYSLLQQRKQIVIKKQKKFVVPKKFELTLKTAGSFISFHIPSTPLEMKSLTRSAHHERALDCVKSGKTQGPGHTSPKENRECSRLEQCFIDHMNVF